MYNTGRFFKVSVAHITSPIPLLVHAYINVVIPEITPCIIGKR